MKTETISIRRPRLNRIINLNVSALFLALVTLASSLRADDVEAQQLRSEPDLPSPLCDEVNVPDGHRLSSRLYALGVQIYRWNGTAWAFVGPEATLFADPGYQGEVGTHYSGPTWEANDGSKVVAARIAGCTPYRGAIPWLRLGATSTSDHGRFAQITFIQRINTIGGTAPAEPGAFIGDEARVPYTTEYLFYHAAND